MWRPSRVGAPRLIVFPVKSARRCLPGFSWRPRRRFRGSAFHLDEISLHSVRELRLFDGRRKKIAVEIYRLDRFRSVFLKSILFFTYISDGMSMLMLCGTVLSRFLYFQCVLFSNALLKKKKIDLYRIYHIELERMKKKITWAILLYFILGECLR